MCYASSCNPLCGDCRPKRIVQAPCPNCGHLQEMRREEYLIFFKLPHRKSIIEKKILEKGPVAAPSCDICGADMVQAFDDAVTPAECKGNRVICGFPCGRRNDPYREGAMPCQTMVPLGKIAG